MSCGDSSIDPLAPSTPEPNVALPLRDRSEAGALLAERLVPCGVPADATVVDQTGAQLLEDRPFGIEPLKVVADTPLVVVEGDMPLSEYI